MFSSDCGLGRFRRGIMTNDKLTSHQQISTSQ
jgi:hypothetical protein